MTAGSGPVSYSLVLGISKEIQLVQDLHKSFNSPFRLLDLFTEACTVVDDVYVSALFAEF